MRYRSDCRALRSVRTPQWRVAPRRMAVRFGGGRPVRVCETLIVLGTAVPTESARAPMPLPQTIIIIFIVDDPRCLFNQSCFLSFHSHFYLFYSYTFISKNVRKVYARYKWVSTYKWVSSWDKPSSSIDNSVSVHLKTCRCFLRVIMCK